MSPVARKGLGFRVWGLGFGVWGLGFGVWGLGFGVWVSEDSSYGGDGRLRQLLVALKGLTVVTRQNEGLGFGV